MLSQQELKLQAAEAALTYIEPLLSPEAVIGVGTGSTADLFIDGLARYRTKFRAAVASSERSAQRLSALGIVVPLAREAVARAVAELGGTPVLRAGFTTDNGNQIVDVHGLAIHDPIALEARLNQVPGVVTNGLFAARPADVALLATQQGIRQL